jgi:hypothetical protein
VKEATRRSSLPDLHEIGPKAATLGPIFVIVVEIPVNCDDLETRP